MKYTNILRWRMKEERGKDAKMQRSEWENEKIRQRRNTVELMWIEPATSATLAIPAIPATPAIHPIPSHPIQSSPIPAYQHLFCSKNIWLDSYLILFYQTSSWQNAYCWCVLHFWKYVNMWIWNIEI
jgi:hypothetical protein